MFFNVPTRKRVLKSPSEEFQRIADVVSKYAIHNTGIGFSLKRTGDSGPQWSEGTKDVRTQPHSTQEQNISVIYGSSIEKELIPFEIDEQKSPLKFKACGQITGVNFNTKKAITLMFINNRLVESPALKKAVDLVYAAYLPKGSHPFVYLSLEIHPANVDVNVHPTKHEVHFLYQDEIVERIQRALDSKLTNKNASRTFKTQVILPGAPMYSIHDMDAKNENPLKQLPPQTAAKDMVRTDSREQKLDKFVTFIKPETSKISFGHSWEINNLNKKSDGVPLPESPLHISEEKGEKEKKSADTLTPNRDLLSEELTLFKEPLRSRRTDIDRLASIQRLRQNIKTECEPQLRKLVCNHSFVGCIDRQFALVQHETSLYIINTPPISKHLFYQIAIHDFGNFNAVRLNPTAPVGVLAKLALDNTEESGWTEADGNKTELANFVVRILKEKRGMLDDYFSLKIDENGDVITIPALLEGYVPFLGNLPIFLLRLATEVNWDEEEACFKSLADELARFYSVSIDEASQYDNKQHQENSNDVGNKRDDWMSIFEHNLYPAIKAKLWPNKTCSKDIVSVANLPELYKVFERC